MIRSIRWKCNNLPEEIKSMEDERQELLRQGLETAFVDQVYESNLAYKPQFISNDHKEGRKVISSIEDELFSCDEFAISVAFITMSGITPLLQTLKELEQKGIKGRILTTDYLSFSEPKALRTLAGLQNITLKMYCTRQAREGFHTKGYIFRKEEMYRLIIGSANMTKTHLLRIGNGIPKLSPQNRESMHRMF